MVNKKYNRYQAIILKIFFKYWTEGRDSFVFARSDIEEQAALLNIKLPKNIGDVPYYFRYRNILPDEIRQKQPKDQEWIIEGAGPAKYRFKLVRYSRIEVNDHLLVTSIPDSTPEIIRRYAKSDEQALLAIVRYNRLTDVFLGLTTYSLQSHLRTTVKNIGQIEIDELYIGIDKRGCHYVIPIQAKGGSDRIGIVQVAQDIAFVEDKYPGTRCRAVATQFIKQKGNNTKVAMFELQIQNDEIKIVDERHYQLVRDEQLNDDAIHNYTD